MVDWAITGFKPLGLKGLRPPKDSGEVVASVGGGCWGQWPLGAAHPVLWPCQSSPKVVLGLLTGTPTAVLQKVGVKYSPSPCPMEIGPG